MSLQDVSFTNIDDLAEQVMTSELTPMFNELVPGIAGETSLCRPQNCLNQCFFTLLENEGVGVSGQQGLDAVRSDLMRALKTVQPLLEADTGDGKFSL